MELAAFMNSLCRTGKDGLKRRLLQRPLIGNRMPAAQFQAGAIHRPIAVWV